MGTYFFLLILTLNVCLLSEFDSLVDLKFQLPIMTSMEICSRKNFIERKELKKGPQTS